MRDEEAKGEAERFIELFHYGTLSLKVNQAIICVNEIIRSQPENTLNQMHYNSPIFGSNPKIEFYKHVLKILEGMLNE